MGYRKFYRGKNAVITGGASGIGKEIALNLAKMGCNIVISDIKLDRLEQTKKEIGAFGVKVYAQKCDVTNTIEIKKFAKNTIKEMGNIHFLFSNAGIAVGGPFEHLMISQWDRILNINMYGMIHVVRAFIPKLIEQGFGHVIVTASIAGTIGIGGLAPYSTSKFANAGFCEALYGEFSHRGIDVSILSPFPLLTNLIETAGFGIPAHLLSDLDPKRMQEEIKIGMQDYWAEFTKKQSILKGFAGGFTVQRATKRYLKKIRKKKLYIYERRYGRMLQFLQGAWPAMYKRFLRSKGKTHVKLMNTIVDQVVQKSKRT